MLNKNDVLKISDRTIIKKDEYILFVKRTNIGLIIFFLITRRLIQYFFRIRHIT